MQDAGVGAAADDGRIGMGRAVAREFVSVFRRQGILVPARATLGHAAHMGRRRDGRCPAHQGQLGAPLEQAHLVQMMLQGHDFPRGMDPGAGLFLQTPDPAHHALIETGIRPSV